MGGKYMTIDMFIFFWSLTTPPQPTPPGLHYSPSFLEKNLALLIPTGIFFFLKQANNELKCFPVPDWLIAAFLLQ